MPQPGETPGPESHGEPEEPAGRRETAPEAPDGPEVPNGQEGAAGPGDERERRRRLRRLRRLGYAVAAAAVAAAAAAPFVWQAVSGSQDDERRPGALSGPAKTAPAADFDDDGLQDAYATGETGGGVSVVYGRKRGPDGGGAGKQGAEGGAPQGERRQRVDLDSPGVPEKERRGVSFGAHTVTRDIDRDGYTDLVASLKSYRRDTRSGLIALWGSPKGLSGGTYLAGTPEDYQNGVGGEEDPLVAGDFTGDGNADLVVRTGSERGVLKGPFSRDGKPGGFAEVPDSFPEAGEDAKFLDAYAGDLNGDGTDDLIDTHATADDGVGGGEVESAYVPGGSGGFGEPDTESLPGIASATIGDVDKDGEGRLAGGRGPLLRPPRFRRPGRPGRGPARRGRASAGGRHPGRLPERRTPDTGNRCPAYRCRG